MPSLPLKNKYILLVLGRVLPLHCRLLMKGEMLRLGILRLANPRKHGEQVEIWWQQYSFPLSGEQFC